MYWEYAVTHMKVFFQHLQWNMEEKLKKYFRQAKQEVNIPRQNPRKLNHMELSGNKQQHNYSH